MSKRKREEEEQPEREGNTFAADSLLEYLRNNAAERGDVDTLRNLQINRRGREVYETMEDTVHDNAPPGDPGPHRLPRVDPPGGEPYFPRWTHPNQTVSSGNEQRWSDRKAMQGYTVYSRTGDRPYTEVTTDGKDVSTSWNGDDESEYFTDGGYYQFFDRPHPRSAMDALRQHHRNENDPTLRRNDDVDPGPTPSFHDMWKDYKAL